MNLIIPTMFYLTFYYAREKRTTSKHAHITVTAHNKYHCDRYSDTYNTQSITEHAHITIILYMCYIIIVGVFLQNTVKLIRQKKNVYVKWFISARSFHMVHELGINKDKTLKKNNYQYLFF